MSSQLADIQSYTSSELEMGIKKSPAIGRYLNILKDYANDPLAQTHLMRHRSWVRCALATLLNKEPTEKICRYWSDQTDHIISDYWNKNSPANADLALFALGKWGSHELNLSSDIDIVIVSKEAPRAEQFKFVKQFINYFSGLTAYGFCYRIDTDLKPGGRLSPLVSSIKQYEDYYWAAGETWERLALVRLRPICGDQSVIENIKLISENFSYRKFLDFALIEDLKHLRQQIHSHYPQDSKGNKNLKLSPGGIRDIELFIHSLQIIHGGKDTSLRSSSTSVAAENLKKSQRFNPADLDTLINSYWTFRHLENTLQAYEDQQTHLWTTDHGVRELTEFNQRAQAVEKIVEYVLGTTLRQPTLPQNEEDQVEWLEKLGFSYNQIKDTWVQLLSKTAVSTRTIRDEQLRRSLVFQFTESIAQNALDKHLALGLLGDFFRSTRAKTHFFNLLIHEPRLINELALLFGCSPYLGGILASRPELIDSFVHRSQETISENTESLLESLTERKLLTTVIASTQFLKNKDTATLIDVMSNLADEIAMKILSTLQSEYGSDRLSILALGKWGTQEMGLRSDLDFIFISRGAPTDADHKISKRFVGRLTEQHRGGSIYSIDMRLRPAGKGGPLIVDSQQLIHYLQTQAEPWERQSYLRCRELSQRDPVKAQIYSQSVRESCLKLGISNEHIKALSHIRLQLLRHENKLDLKYAPGGLIDLEFATQINCLKEKSKPVSGTTIELFHFLDVSEKDRKKLIANYNELRRIEQLLQLSSESSTSLLDEDPYVLSRVAKLLNIAPEALIEDLQARLDFNLKILKSCDPRQK